MYVNFESLPANARVWVYQSNKEFSEADVAQINFKTQEFIEQWTRHGKDLKGSFTVLYNLFLVIAVDENFASASGCSIDASVRFVQSLEQDLQKDLLNKLNVSFKVGTEINVVSLQDFKNFGKANKILPETIVFNNLIQTKGELQTAWEVPAKQSWHAKYIS